jgi:hypothetical protein
MAEEQQVQDSDITQSFRQVYTHIVQNVTLSLSENTDSTVLARISDEINEYHGLFLQVSMIILPVLIRHNNISHIVCTASV